MTELAFAAYRPNEANGDELLQLLAEDLATLRRRGHVTARPAPVVRSENGELLVVLEWSSDHAVEDAHADPEVVALWRRKAQLAGYMSPDEIAGANAAFARWEVIADL